MYKVLDDKSRTTKANESSSTKNDLQDFDAIPELPVCKQFILKHAHFHDTNFKQPIFPRQKILFMQAIS